MIKTDRAIIVEGKYDKIRLDSVIDGIVIETDGFGIFNDRQKQELIRRLAKTRGLLVLTDSDAAGFKIRSFITSLVPPETVMNAYIPDIFGKEKRKDTPGREGKIGVEGMSQIVLVTALRKAGLMCEETDAPQHPVTRTDFFEDGISGRSNSLAVRRALLKRLNLPSRMSAGSLLQMINAFMTYDEYKQAMKEIHAHMAEENAEVCSVQV